LCCDVARSAGRCVHTCAHVCMCTSKFADTRATMCSLPSLSSNRTNDVIERDKEIALCACVRVWTSQDSARCVLELIHCMPVLATHTVPTVSHGTHLLLGTTTCAASCSGGATLSRATFAEEPCGVTSDATVRVGTAAGVRLGRCELACGRAGVVRWEFHVVGVC
jgi:hypothetical protein